MATAAERVRPNTSEVRSNVVRPQVVCQHIVVHIGLMLSGDLGQPILDADTIVVTDGRITGISKADVDSESGDDHRCDELRSGAGAYRQPCSSVAGDWTPQQN